MFDQSILKFDEKVVFTMRELFIKKGYRQFKMSKFEEYDLYSKNKEFLLNDGVITFNDTNGKLLALKPDVTLSIIKNSKDSAGEVQKYFYNENVYRIAEGSKTYKEILQTGLECIGSIGEKEVLEVTLLALESLKTISDTFVLQISNVALVEAILEENQINGELKQQVLVAISQKNVGKAKELLTLEQFSNVKVLFENYESASEVLKQVEKTCKKANTISVLESFAKFILSVCESGYSKNVKIDFSVTSLDGYYSGIIFKGFINGIATKVLSGGEYDNLLKKMGRTSSAIGFAVYLDELERFSEDQPLDDGYINVALPKGRLGEKVYDMFEKAGFECPAIKENNRKLIFENKEKKIRYFWVKPSDVTIYVERGSADIGVAGKDILLEYTPDVYELLDLNIGKCRMAVASKKDFIDDESKTLRVATKFKNIAQAYYTKKCRDIDIIHLNGSIEIAPILGLSDVIVDIVETGKTLLENDLIPFETIVPISARLIVNKSSFGFKANKIKEIEEGLFAQVKQDD